MSTLTTKPDKTRRMRGLVKKNLSSQRDYVGRVIRIEGRSDEHFVWYEGKYRAKNNACFAWLAIKAALESDHPLPEWVKEYLRRCSERVEEFVISKRGRTDLALKHIFELSGRSKFEQAFALLSEEILAGQFHLETSSPKVARGKVAVRHAIRDSTVGTAVRKARRNFRRAIDRL